MNTHYHHCGFVLIGPEKLMEAHERGCGKCCEKCKILAGMAQPAYDCADSTCPCHVRKGEVQGPYSQRDHYHCWNQEKEPACGLAEHTVCCLCGVPVQEKIHKINGMTVKRGIDYSLEGNTLTILNDVLLPLESAEYAIPVQEKSVHGMPLSSDVVHCSDEAFRDHVCPHKESREDDWEKGLDKFKNGYMFHLVYYPEIKDWIRTKKSEWGVEEYLAGSEAAKKETRIIALQEAASAVRGMSLIKMVDYSPEEKSYNQALEDAAHEIEAKI